MEDIWTVLGLEPTEDTAEIRRAYTQKAKECRPEEDPEGFLNLRRACRAALARVEGNEAPDPHAGEPKDGGWTCSGAPQAAEKAPNPFEDHPAIRQFLERYTGKQRRDPRGWLDYFTSGDFLDAAWDRRFTALLLERVTRLEGEYPVNREFLLWLCAAYQFEVDRQVYLAPDGGDRVEFSFGMYTGAQFDGIGPVLEIAKKGPAPKRLKGAELAMCRSFSEYRRLAALADKAIWSEEDLQVAGRVLEYYVISNLSDSRPADTERHPAGIRLIGHFLRREGLPDELYRLVWQKLELQTAVMGRARLLYGPLRERALERLPELAGQKREDFSRLRMDFRDYAVSTYKRSGEDARATGEDIRRTDDFFARADFRKALLDRRFVEEDMLRTFVAETNCDYYLQTVIRFYTEHETAPFARQVAARAREMLKYQALAGRLKRDRETEIPAGAVTLRSAPFFRHWINTGFFQAKDRDAGRPLLDYLNRELPYLPDWSRKLLEHMEEGVLPGAFAFRLGGDAVEVRFHLRHMEFFRNGERVYRACLPWERLAREQNPEAFFFFLPIAAAACGQYGAVKAEILHRLADTAAPEDGRETIAACLADQVCRLPPPGAERLAPEDGREEEEVPSLPPESALPFEIFAENADCLYGCVWFQQDRTLMLFHQTPFGRKPVQWFGDVPDARSAVELAREALQQQLFPAGLPMDALRRLPDAVYAQPDYYVVVSRDRDAPPLWSAPVELLGEEVTAEQVEELLAQFFDNRIERLELSWRTGLPAGAVQEFEPRRSLVFVKGDGGYACLWFDDLRAEFCALLEKPEVYWQEEGGLKRVPFRQGKLFRQAVHENLFTIRRRLETVLRQASSTNGAGLTASELWTCADSVSHGRSKYNLDKRQLGGFLLERARNSLNAPLYFSSYPDLVLGRDASGGTETLEATGQDRSRVQAMALRFLEGGWEKLRMTWGREEGRRRHIVLLRDGDCFLMAWVLEEKRSARFHVADAGTYMDVEGKKYPKDTFRGRVVPAYLIHRGAAPLRGALELLLANLDNPGPITDKIAEYAEEKPVKARPYETVWAELVNDGEERS